MFSYLPDFNIPGLINTLEQYSRYEVDTIVFTHAANPAAALDPGTQEDIRFTAQYVKVFIELGVRLKIKNVMIAISGHSRCSQG